MKKILKFLTLAVVIFGVVFGMSGTVFAEEEAASEEASSEETTSEEVPAEDEAAMSISISPVNKVLSLEPDTVYEDTFTVTNNSSSEMRFEVHASPYSYTFSEEDDEYRLGFSQENNYTQITHWITFMDSSGNYVATTKFVVEPKGTVEVRYRIATPSSIPAGGQYAVLFAHTLSDSTNTSGIRTEASPGLVIYGHANGETKIEGTVRDSELSQTIEQDGEVFNVISGSAKVKNTGNVDFMAQGTLKVQGIFGRVYYETPASRGRISVIPEVELTVSDVWENTPYFGLFKASWTVVAAGSVEEPIERVILILPPPVLIFMILLLTIIIIWIIILVRKRKERRSRFAI